MKHLANLKNGLEIVGITSCFLGAIAFIASPLSPLQAQVIPDTSLPQNSIVTPQGNILNITGGMQAGVNLFHSFQQFSVLTGNTAFFNNALNVQNILARVTGSSISTIDGILKANGTANLFLINPNGVIFGENARLDLGGSFLASTASSIIFPDGIEFSAKDPSPNSLLSINVPLGLQFGDTEGSIINRAQIKDDATTTSALQVQQGRTIGLVGGDIFFEGSSLGVEQGRVELGSVAADSFVRFIPSGNAYRLDYADVTNFRDLNLSQGAVVASINGGDLQIQGRQINITEGSQILAITLGEVTGGNIFIRATDAIELVGQSPERTLSSIFTITAADATGDAGNLTVETKTLRISDGAQMGSPTFGQGNSGNIVIRATDAVEVSGVAPDYSNFSGIIGTAFPDSTGHAGNLTLTTERLRIADGGQVTANALGTGNAGKLTIKASDRVDIVGVAEKGSPPSTLGTFGTGGQVDLETGFLSILNGGNMQARDSGTLGANALSVRASDRIEVVGQSPIGFTYDDGNVLYFNSQISASTFTSTKESGAMQLVTKLLSIRDGGSVNASTFTVAKGGDINIHASEKVEIIGRSSDNPSQIDSRSGIDAFGKGGNITITSPQLSIENGSAITTTSLGEGDAGDIVATVDRLNILKGGSITANTMDGKAGEIRINASESIDIAEDIPFVSDPNSLFGSSISSSTLGNGSGGNIFVQTPRLSLRDGGNISAQTYGIGDAGNIEIHADSVAVIGAGSPSTFAGITILSASAISSASIGIGQVRGKAGNISIEAKQVSVSEGGSISSETGSLADAGNLMIRATDFVEIDGEKPEGDDRRFPSTIRTAVGNPEAVGKAGDLLIETGRFSIINGAQVSSATFGKGDAGDITIRTSDSTLLTGVSPNTGRVSSLSTSVGEEAVGNGGNLTLETKKLRVEQGAQIFTGTLGNGNSGNLTIRATDGVVVSGSSPDGETASGLFASTETGAIGQGGDLRIETGNLVVSDRAQVTVRDQAGSKGAGNLQVFANSVLLDHGLLSAETRAGLQGNISLQASNLQLRHHSLLQANALGTASGGNITIDANTLAALENSDITANAQDAKGGRVIINTQGIFGTAFRPQQTAQSDITASSELGNEFSGVVQINTPDVDPSRGLVTLSVSPVDVSKLAIQRCLADRRGNEFVITGRGGLPANPSEALNSNRVLEDLGTAKEVIGAVQESRLSFPPLRSLAYLHNSITEANNWAIAANGKITLVTSTANPTTNPLWANTPKCIAP